MATVFSEILNMSMTGSLVIAIVLLTRLALKRAPKIYSYALWAVVLFRLLCPVSLSAPVSVLEFTDAAVTSAPQGRLAGTSSVQYFAQAEPQEARPESQAATAEPAGREWDAMALGSWIWVLGVGILGLSSLVSYWNLRKTLREAVPWRENIYLADRIGTPFVLGLISPKIYLPSNTPRKERRYILAHERHHIRRLDHAWKWLAYLALCLHWFNPMVWAAFLLGGKDMEMSCDEAVIGQLGSHIRADYSQSLLRLATHRTGISGTPLAFGEGNTKGRVKNMAKWHPPKLWVSLLCLAVCMGVLAACAVNPEQGSETTGSLEIQFNDLELALPAGYEAETGQTGLEFVYEGTTVGGVCAYEKPGFDLIFGGEAPHEDWNGEEWTAALGLPETVDPTMGYFGSSNKYGDYEIEYFRDLPEEEKEQVGDYVRFHVFFIGDTQVYDVWFDRLAAEAGLEEQVLSTVTVQNRPQQGQPVQTGIDLQKHNLAQCQEALEVFQAQEWAVTCQRQYNGEEEFSQGDWPSWLETWQWDSEKVTYMDTLNEDGVITVMLRIDEPYPGAEASSECYFVNFQFAEDGSFWGVQLQVGLFQDGGFTQTETVVHFD